MQNDKVDSQINALLKYLRLAKKLLLWQPNAMARANTVYQIGNLEHSIRQQRSI